MPYFSEREKGPTPRTLEEITPEAWGGMWALITSRSQDGSFGNSFPDQCPDGQGVVGHDAGLMEATAHGDGIIWPVPKNELPDLVAVMDLLEFCETHVAQPIKGSYHSFFSHNHLGFDVEEGQALFRSAVNRILARNGIAFEMDEDGVMLRLAPPELTKVLKIATFETGDAVLDELLEDARDKFMDPNLKVRKEALEKIWDAFERLKTIESGKDKKASAMALLSKAIGDADLRERVSNEMQALSDIGNSYMIRHTEVGKKPITHSEHVDYLFQRMFAVVHLLLKSTGRAA